MKVKLFVIGLFLIAVFIVICSVLFIKDKSEQKPVEYYNVIYHNCNTELEYQDVTDLYYDNIGVYFKTQDGATVLLEGGAIEIIPLNVD